MTDEHDLWMIERFPLLYSRNDNGDWRVNRKGTLLDPLWEPATTNEQRTLEQLYPRKP